MLVTPDNFEYAYRVLDAQKRIVSDTETTGLARWHNDKIIGYALAAPHLGDDVFYFPFRHKVGQNLPPYFKKPIRKLMSKPNVVYTGWNYKFDIEMMLKEGIPIPERAEDVMLAAHLMNENERNFRLKDLSVKYISPDAQDAESQLKLLLAEMGLDKGDMAYLPPELVETYACDDCRLTELMRCLYVKPLREWGLYDIWQEVNLYMLATVRMEQTGLLLDQELTHQYIEEADRMAQKAYRKLAKMAGYDINPRSNPQLQAFMGMESTRKELLEEMEGDPRAEALTNYRMWAKCNNTYYRPYLEYIDSQGILHANLNLHGTISGRLSASDPNLQAVARWTEIYKIKDVFIAKPDHFILSADYSQAELRLGAHYANERAMARILNKGGDIHGETALLLGIDRDPAKRINFGVFYGIGARKLARVLKIPFDEAQQYLTTYHRKFRNIRHLYQFMQGQALVQGYIRLWTGRVRRYNTEDAEPHKALSNLIQGGVGEQMRKKIMELDQLVQDGQFRMVLQVHDQIIFDIPEDNRRIVPEIKGIMEHFPQFHIAPPKVDLMAGYRWGKLSKWDKFLKGE